jgi:hypothetical protein
MKILFAGAMVIASVTAAMAQYLGNYTANPYLPPAPPADLASLK